MKPLRCILALCLLACMLAGCGGQAPAPSSVSSGAKSVAASVAAPSTAPPTQAAESLPAAAPACYFEQMADDAIAQMGLTGGESDFDKVKAAFRYVIRLTSFIDYNQPELTDNWRFLDSCGTAPTIYEVMATGPLLHGIGTCEHYSAALMVLLERMGFPAQYVPGLTYSVEGKLIDHAWTMVEIQGQWYHIDAQLEDNILRGGTIAYRYYLKGDEEFAAHHVWGNRLKTPDPHSAALPACPANAPTPQPEPIEQNEVPDVQAEIQKARSRRAAAATAPSKLEPTGLLPPLPGEYAAQLAEAEGTSNTNPGEDGPAPSSAPAFGT